MNSRPYLIHALSPLHAGTGQAVDVIDLPIARMKATHIPFVPGSSVKGVLRWTRREALYPKNDDFLATFGPETENASDHAGALMVGDARLLLMPVRSFVGTFAYVTSPLLLELASRDLRDADMVAPSVPRPERPLKALHGKDSLTIHAGKVYLEDLDLAAEKDRKVKAWGAFLAPLVFPSAPDMMSRRFLVVDDETMSFLWETATQVDARIRIDPRTRTVAEGALWYEESLPPETVLIGSMLATAGMRWIEDAETGTKTRHKWSARQAMELALPREEILQFGGKATAGRGRCRILPLSAPQTETTNMETQEEDTHG